MPKKLNVNIKESHSEIERHNVDSGNRKFNLTKELVLISLKEKEFNYITELASQYDIERRTVSRWIKIYKYQGIDSLFTRRNENNARRVISVKMEGTITSLLKEGIKMEKLYSCEEIQKEILAQYGLRLPYHTLYATIKRLKMKLAL